MTTKLTLTMDQDIIKKAKDYASKEGLSLSGLVENYFRILTAMESDHGKDGLSPIVKSLMGSFKAPNGFNYDYKKLLQE